MRRPKFSRWIRGEVLALAGVQKFNLRKFAADVQRAGGGDSNGKDGNRELAAALMLYAHENNQVDKLMSYVYDEELAGEYDAVEQRLGMRSVERLALRGTPMMSLPEPYRELLARFAEAYHTPENITAEKQALWEQTHAALLVSGQTPSEIAQALDLDPANTSAYLSSGDTARFTLETIRQIAHYATSEGSTP